MLFTLGLFVAITAALVPLVQRDLRRAVERQRMRRLVGKLQTMVPALRAAAVAFSGLGMAAARAAADMQRNLQRINATMPTPASLAHLRRIADSLTVACPSCRHELHTLHPFCRCGCTYGARA